MEEFLPVESQNQTTIEHSPALSHNEQCFLNGDALVRPISGLQETVYYVLKVFPFHWTRSSLTYHLEIRML